MFAVPFLELIIISGFYSVSLTLGPSAWTRKRARSSCSSICWHFFRFFRLFVGPRWPVQRLKVQLSKQTKVHRSHEKQSAERKRLRPYYRMGPSHFLLSYLLHHQKIHRFLQVLWAKPPTRHQLQSVVSLQLSSFKESNHGVLHFALHVHCNRHSVPLVWWNASFLCARQREPFGYGIRP